MTPLTVNACMRCGEPDEDLAPQSICEECEYQMAREAEHEALVRGAKDHEEAEAVARWGVGEADR